MVKRSEVQSIVDEASSKLRNRIEQLQRQLENTTNRSEKQKSAKPKREKRKRESQKDSKPECAICKRYGFRRAHPTEECTPTRLYKALKGKLAKGKNPDKWKSLAELCAKEFDLGSHKGKPPTPKHAKAKGTKAEGKGKLCPYCVHHHAPDGVANHLDKFPKEECINRPNGPLQGLSGKKRAAARKEYFSKKKAEKKLERARKKGQTKVGRKISISQSEREGMNHSPAWMTRNEKALHNLNSEEERDQSSGDPPAQDPFNFSNEDDGFESDRTDSSDESDKKRQRFVSEKSGLTRSNVATPRRVKPLKPTKRNGFWLDAKGCPQSHDFLRQIIRCLKNTCALKSPFAPATQIHPRRN